MSAGPHRGEESGITGEAIRDSNLEDLVACPSCDLLHRRRVLAEGEAARCARCGTVIETRKRGAVDAVILSSVAMAVLLVLALWAPFLSLSGAGVTQRMSLVDAGLALGDGALVPLSLLLIGLTVALPFLRALLHLWALLPPRLGFAALPGAPAAFRAAMNLRPWAMAEIFMIGVAVSVVKLAGLASVEAGPAIYALAGVVVVLAYENALLCRETVWRMVLGEETPEPETPTSDTPPATRETPA